MTRHAEVQTVQYKPRNGRRVPTRYEVTRYENGEQVSRESYSDKPRAQEEAKAWGVVPDVASPVQVETVCGGCYNWTYNGRSGNISKDRVGGKWTVSENGKHCTITAHSIKDAKAKIERN